MDGTQHVTPEGAGTIFNNLVMGAWALGGSLVRGQNEWRNPETGKFSIWRMGASVVTAFVLGEIAISICVYFHVQQEIVGGLAATLGYVGAPATMGAVTGWLQARKDDTKP